MIDAHVVDGRSRADPALRLPPGFDIPTKGSFSRDRWSQLTHLFNLTTPHVQSCNQFPVLFSVLAERRQVVRNVRQNLAHEKGPQTKRLVRNLSAYIKVETEEQGRLRCQRGTTVQTIKGWE